MPCRDLAQPQEERNAAGDGTDGTELRLHAVFCCSGIQLGAKQPEIIQSGDRAIAFIDKQRAMTAYDRELEVRHEVEPFHGKNMHLDILVENMGRVNYGPYPKLAEKRYRRLRYD